MVEGTSGWGKEGGGGGSLKSDAKNKQERCNCGVGNEPWT
jgi:hypothetical protein